ncbi:MAG: hypothetical protein IPO27_01435 [Bacteroidetes bacterium]|nr:hypothetical protein [Bacteroidota bacterium]
MKYENDMRQNDVGRMQQLQLLTTEELYRYVFELMERVEKLEKNNAR